MISLTEIIAQLSTQINDQENLIEQLCVRQPECTPTPQVAHQPRQPH